ncbi:MAG: 2-C-methyl-D-erythritol 4-phosphate cytidylyltransferase [Sphaerochaetaceae bacterium]|nr:2-C-methyl-D-erythritol 4-phosphate cytidylyltransferase [Sphaerochaetaceae bacterium]
MKSASHALILTAAGSSVRFGRGKKEFCTINGISVLLSAALPFTQIEGLKAIVVTYRKGTLKETQESLKGLDPGIPLYFAEGGSTRQGSVFNGLKELKKHIEEDLIVSIHDGARPYITEKLAERVLDKAEECGAAVPVMKMRDTLCCVKDSVIEKYIDRSSVAAVQTPQCFRFSSILKAHEEAAADGKEYTDDTGIYSAWCGPVFAVEGEETNIKITFPGDLK